MSPRSVRERLEAMKRPRPSGNQPSETARQTLIAKLSTKKRRDAGPAVVAPPTTGPPNVSRVGDEPVLARREVMSPPKTLRAGSYDSERHEDRKPEPQYLIHNRWWFGDLVPDWLARRKELTWTAKAVWGHLLRKLSDAEGFAYPKQETIAAALGISVRTVKEAIKTLKTSGLLSVKRRRVKHGKWKSDARKTVYYLVGNHPWSEGAKTRRPKVEVDEDDAE
jgi:biotin operon repressor